MKKLNKKKVKWITKEVKQLGSLDKVIYHYNYKRSHTGLSNGKLRTPYQAFKEKSRN